MTNTTRPPEEEGGNGWISVLTRIPAKEEAVLVYAPGGAMRISIDEWVTYREAPVGWSSATIETGEGWSNHEFEQVSHWMPLPAAPGAAAAARNQAAQDVLAERRRQIEAEGWTPEHDDEHTAGELAQAAADLCVYGTDFRVVDPDGDRMIGWGLTEAHRDDRRRQLVIAGALVVAEIERIDRTAQAQGGKA